MARRRFTALTLLLLAAGTLGSCQRSPKRGTAQTEPFSDHVGSRTCVECHAEISDAFRTSPMGQSLQRIDADVDVPKGEFTRILEGGPVSRFQVGRGGQEWKMTFSQTLSGRPSTSQTETLAVAVGSGTHGVTYLIERPGGFLFEAPASWYRRIDGWQMSPGYDSANHDGFSRPVTTECLYCHSGGVRPAQGTRNGYQSGRIFVEPAISCERCHGSGQRHVDLQRRSEGADDASGEIVNPAKLDPTLAMDVCLQCHRSDGGGVAVLRKGKRLSDFEPGGKLSDVVAQFEYANVPLSGVGVHFAGKMTQMRNSPCFTKSDGALTCLTCHTIHHRKSSRQQKASYRQRCVNCHSDCGLAKTERIAVSPEDDCADCHMPTVVPEDVPFSQITDHRIRVPGRDQDAPIDPGLIELQSLDPTHSDAETERNLGIAYYQLAGVRPERAKTYLFRAGSLLQRATERDPSDHVARATLGRTTAALGNSGRAQEIFNKALERRPNDALTLTQLGFCCLDLKDHAAAAQHFKTALDREPYFVDALKGLMRVYRVQGKQADAEAVRQRLIALDHRWKYGSL